jgi:hypothetical protein
LASSGDLHDVLKGTPLQEQPPSPQVEVKELTRRQQVLEELKQSESLYTKFLVCIDFSFALSNSCLPSVVSFLNQSILVDEFAIPLREKAKVSKKLLPDVVDSIFSNVTALYEFHKILNEALQKASDPAKPFLELAAYLKQYTLYINNYPKALSAIDQLKNNKRFQLHLSEKRFSEKCGGLDFMSYLVMPIQRIPSKIFCCVVFF